MQKTVRQFISDIAQSVNAENGDDFISPKYIYSTSQSVISDFLKKSNSGERLTFKIIEGWSEIPVLPMISVPITECNLGVNVCQRLMRSQYRLPEMYESKFGGLIKMVIALNLATEYKPCFSAANWVAKSKRPYGNEKYYFFSDGYLYIPIKKGDDESPEILRLEAYFKNKKEVNDFNTLINGTCESCNTKVENCKPFLDYPMVIPYYLENDVKKEVIQLMLRRSQIQPDENPNLNSLQKVNQSK